MNLPLFALRYRSVVLAATVLTLAFGLYRYRVSPRREDPEFIVRACQVSTQWPGAPAEDVENLVTDPLEEAFNELSEVKKITSLTVVGLSTITVELLDQIKDVDAVWDKVRAKVSQVQPSLPDGVHAPHVNSDFGDTSAMVVALYQKLPDNPERAEEVRYSPRELEVFADDVVKNRLLLIDSIARIDLHGVQKEVIYLEADPGKWSQLALTTTELERTLSQRNIVAPGGMIDTTSARLNVKPSGDITAVNDLKQQVIGLPSGSQATSEGLGQLQRFLDVQQGREFRATVHLEDIGLKVRRAYQDPPQIIARILQEKVDKAAPCVVLSIMMKDGKNVVNLRKEVMAAIDELKSRNLPGDVEFELVSDQPRIVQESIKAFISNLYQAIIIVVLVAFLMLGLRAAIVMATAIPLVMIVSIGMMGFFGVQIEQMSLAALIIALGMLVDCAIEVADNVHRFMEEGHPPFQATVEGVQQIAFPTLIGTLTSVAAFFPMLLLEGGKGEYTYSLPVVVSLTLALSWIIAMTVTSLMAYWLIRPTTSTAPIVWILGLITGMFRKQKFTGGGIGVLYEKLCGLCLRFRVVTILASIVLFLFSVGLLVSGQIATTFFPAGFRNQFVINVYLPEGTPIHHTDDVCRDVEQLLRRLDAEYVATQADGSHMLKNAAFYIGQGGPRFYLNVTPEEPSPNYAQIVVNTHSPALTAPFIADIRKAVREGLPAKGDLPAIRPMPGVRVTPQKLDMGPPIDAPIGIRISGPKIPELRRIAGEIKQILRKTPGTYDVYDMWGNLGFQVSVDINEERANLASVSNATIARTLNAFYSGHHLTTYREGDHQVPVMLRLPPSERGNVAAISQMYVEGERVKVPIDSVAKIQTDLETVKIRRRNRSRMIEVRSRVLEGFLPNPVLAEAMEGVRQIESQLPPGYWIEIGGEQEESSKGQAETSICFLVSLLLIVFLLIVFFNSIGKTIIILMAVPLATSGSLIGLYITRMPMGFMEGLGFLSLAGIVINGGIVLIDFVEHMMKEKLAAREGLSAPGEKSIAGLSPATFRQCILEGGRLRITPIALTTLTTVGGLIPLAISGGPLFEGLAVVLIFGLLVGSMLTLFVVPSIYALAVENFGLQVFPPEEKPVSPVPQPTAH